MSIYFFDPIYSKQARLRLEYDSKLNFSIAQDLKNMLHELTQNLHTFSMLSEWVVNESKAE